VRFASTRLALAAKSNIIGAVLNRVNVDRNPYYYSHYYRKDYANYYASTDSTPKG